MYAITYGNTVPFTCILIFSLILTYSAFVLTVCTAIACYLLSTARDLCVAYESAFHIERGKIFRLCCIRVV